MRSSLKKNYLYNLVFQVFSILAPFITTPYISRILGAESIGKYSYALSIVTYFGIFGSIGITTYAQIEIAKNRDNFAKCRKIISELITIKTVLMMVAIIFYGFFLFIIRGSDNAIIFFLLLLYLFGQLNDVSWVLQGLEKFKETVSRNIFFKIMSIISLFLFVKNADDLFLYVIIIQGFGFLGNFALWPCIREYFDFSLARKAVKLKVLKKYLKPSLVFFIPTIATGVYTLLDKSMIGWFTDSSLQNGYYEQSYKIIQIILSILTVLGTVTLPRIAYASKIDFAKTRILIDKTIDFILLTSLPMFFGILCVAKYIIPAFLGSGYSDCVILLQIFGMLFVIIGLDNTIGRQCLMALDRQNNFNRGVIIGALVNFISNLILIPKYGAIGAAISSVVAEFIILILFIYYSRDVLSDKKKTFGKYFIFSFAMFIVVESIPSFGNDLFDSAFKIILGGCIYGFCLLASRDKYFFTVLKWIKRSIKTYK